MSDEMTNDFLYDQDSYTQPKPHTTTLPSLTLPPSQSIFARISDSHTGAANQHGVWNSYLKPSLVDPRLFGGSQSTLIHQRRRRSRTGKGIQLALVCVFRGSHSRQHQSTEACRRSRRSTDQILLRIQSKLKYGDPQGGARLRHRR